MKRFLKNVTIVGILLFSIANVNAQNDETKPLDDTSTVKKLMREGAGYIEQSDLKMAYETFERAKSMFDRILNAADKKEKDMVKSIKMTKDAEKLLKNEDLDGALEILNQAIDLYPDNLEAYKLRGSCRLSIEKAKEKRSQNFVTLNNDYTKALQIIERRGSKVSKSTQSYKELEKEKAKILINRAYTKFLAMTDAGFFSAVQDYSEAVKIDPSNWDGFIGRATVYFNLGDCKKEGMDYITALGLMKKHQYKLSDGEEADFYMKIAYSFLKCNDNAKAYTYAQQAYNLGHPDAGILMEKTKTR